MRGSTQRERTESVCKS